MMMEAQEETLGCKDQSQVVKGKRTKRQRPVSPLRLMIGSSLHTGGEGCGGEGSARFSDNSSLDRVVLASPTTSINELTTTTTTATSTDEEEDMANCLILLAQGQTRNLSSSSSPEPTANNYQCKTCNRCFPSFQALGGHRASHKKPKAANNHGHQPHQEKNNKVLAFMAEDHHRDNNHHHQDNDTMSTTLSLQIANGSALFSTTTNSNNNKPNKVHECSICGAEFSSGQALGGHMRRHRAFASTATATTSTKVMSSDVITTSPESQQSKKPRNILQVDLNLPAPEDDHHHHHRESKFSFASKEQVIVFSASSLVDCHY